MVFQSPFREKKFNSFRGESKWSFPCFTIFDRKEPCQTQIFETTFRQNFKQ